MKIGDTVSHIRYGTGVVEHISSGVVKYVRVWFEAGTITLPATTLAVVSPDTPFMAGDRVEKDGRQGTVTVVDLVQVNVAWDDDKEPYVPATSTGLTLLPPLAGGTQVKHKWTSGRGEMARTPRRGETHATVQWKSGLVSNILMDALAPVQPQEPVENKRTVDDALAEIKTEIDKWAKVGAEAEEKVRVLTEQATVLLNAKRHATLVESIEKW